MKDFDYPSKVVQGEYDSGQLVGMESDTEANQPQISIKEELLSLQDSKSQYPEAEQIGTSVSKQTIPTEEENDNLSAKNTSMTVGPVSYSVRGEATVSDSQDGQSLELANNVTVVQKRRSSQRENHNAHTQRCREKINQMFRKLNEALPPRSDGSHPRKKAEILTRALEIVKQLQMENISLKKMLQEKSWVPSGQFSGSPGNVVGFPIADHQLPLFQRYTGEFARTTWTPMNGDIHSQLWNPQLGTCTLPPTPPISLPLLPLHSANFHENKERCSAASFVSNTPKLPPIISNVEMRPFGVAQIEKESTGSLTEWNGGEKTNWFPSADNSLGDKMKASNVAGFSMIASSTERMVGSIQELEQDSAGIVPQTVNALTPRKQHKDI